MSLPAPYYTTKYGAAYLGDALELVRCLKDASVDLIMTSPPFGLRRKKEYGNVDADEYVAWFLPFGREFRRVLKDKGSLVVDIGGSWNRGVPTKSLYNFELLVALCKETGFHLAEDFYWFNPAKLPTPAEWVTVRRVRVKDAVNTIWWLSKTPFPRANNKAVLKPYSASMLELLQKGYKPKLRPSGHDISSKFSNNHGGAIPPNLISVANTESNGTYLKACRQSGLKPHPARYPRELPEFFIKLLTEENELVLDPFAGSNVTGEAAERLGRRWISFEISEPYLRGSQFRFQEEDVSKRKQRRSARVRRLIDRVQRSLF
ncbi:MAG TPA: site-specific DNA-methyltransferase [Candidatus Xenobia bacterium]|nr:site-specific DNA-methyltransferase [Candidatus Xenobia bacterium]